MGVDRIIGGLERRSGLMTDKERKTVAYHEAGHAVVGWFLEHADPLLKVTIIPRSSGALGFAQYLPQELSLHTSDQLNDMMCMALGGRAAEAHFFGSVTNGAANDLQKVTAIANQMVTVFGMSDKVGQISYQSGGGGDMEFTKPYSEATAERIDEEVKRMIDAMYERTLQVVDERQKEITQVAELLLENETINVDDVVKLIGSARTKCLNRMKTLFRLIGTHRRALTRMPKKVQLKMLKKLIWMILMIQNQTKKQLKMQQKTFDDTTDHRNYQSSKRGRDPSLKKEINIVILDSYGTVMHEISVENKSRGEGIRVQYSHTTKLIINS